MSNGGSKQVNECSKQDKVTKACINVSRLCLDSNSYLNWIKQDFTTVFT